MMYSKLLQTIHRIDEVALLYKNNIKISIFTLLQNIFINKLYFVNSYEQRYQIKYMINKNIKITIACDHAGFYLKEKIKRIYHSLEIIDLGTDHKDSVDYPDYANKLALYLLKDKKTKGILICGTGIGMSIAVNRHKHIRAALCHNAFSAEMARKHNDANVLILGARVMNEDELENIIDNFLVTKFELGRHKNRVDKL